MHGLSNLHRSLDHYYNSPATPQCIYDIIVIDDGSYDGSSKIIKATYPDLIILSGDGSLWWSGAVNRGAKYAMRTLDANYLLLWNDDIIPHIDYFNNLSEHIIKGKPAILASTVLDSQSGEIWSKVKYFNTRTGKFSNTTQIQQRKYIYEWSTGMGTLYSVRLIREVGLWDDKRFPQYYGDADHSIRVSKLGYKIICPDNIVINNPIESTFPFPKNLTLFLKSLSPSKIGSKWNIKIRYKFFKKHCISIFCVYEFLKIYARFFKKYIASNRRI